MDPSNETPAQDVTSTPTPSMETEPSPPPSQSAAPETPSDSTPSAEVVSDSQEPPPPTPEIDISELMGRQEVKAEVQRAAKVAAEKAVEAERKRAKQEADRAEMAEVERLKLEKTEAESAMREAQAATVQAVRERDLASVLVTRSLKLASPQALAFVRHEAFAACDADPDLGMELAVDSVLKEHEYLVVPTTPVDPSVPAEAPPRASTAPPQRPTQTPAAPVPQNPVDAMSMTPEEYQKHKRANHGLH